MVTFIRMLKNLAKMFKVELYLSSKNGELDDEIVIINDGHLGVNDTDCFVDDINNVQKGGQGH